MFMVGIGSALLHGTQTWLGEVIDEFSMLLASLLYLFCADSLHPWTSGSFSVLFYSATVGSIIAVTGLYVHLLKHGIFSAAFGTLILLIAGLMRSSPVLNEGAVQEYETAKRGPDEQGEFDHKPDYVKISESILIGIVLAGLGFASWLVDQACVQYDWKQPGNFWLVIFHPIWHLATAATARVFLRLLLDSRIAVTHSIFARTISGSFILKSKKD